MTKQLKKELKVVQELYALIPSFPCITGCNDCCQRTTPGWADCEWEAIPEEKRKLPSKADYLCPYVKNGGCSIYEIRPLSCRLFATTQHLKCPHGCGKKISPENMHKIEQTYGLLSHKLFLERWVYGY